MSARRWHGSNRWRRAVIGLGGWGGPPCSTQLAPDQVAPGCVCIRLKARDGLTFTQACNVYRICGGARRIQPALGPYSVSHLIHVGSSRRPVGRKIRAGRDQGASRRHLSWFRLRSLPMVQNAFDELAVQFGRIGPDMRHQRRREEIVYLAFVNSAMTAPPSRTIRPERRPAGLPQRDPSPRIAVAAFRRRAASGRPNCDRSAGAPESCSPS